MKYYVIAGERSGDLHASNLMRQIRQRDETAQFRCWGGNLMEEAGGYLVNHYKNMAYMGLWDVIRNMNNVYSNLRHCKNDIIASRPDALILVDYSGFNMRIAKFAKYYGYKVFYYISPKIWAWQQKRALSIKKYVDHMFVIFPFEKDFYKKFNFPVDYVGNPTLDVIKDYKPKPDFKARNGLSEKPIIAVLPGSRKSEVEEMLHFMVCIIPSFTNYQFVVAGVSNLDEKYYERFKRGNMVHIVYDQTYDLLGHAEAAMVTSGTATLETAFFEVPQVVCYSTNFFTYLAGKMLIQIKYISLVNIIANKKVVTELIQSEFCPTNIITELKKILYEPGKRNGMIDEYKQIKNMMGDESASKNTAELIMKYLNRSREESNVTQSCSDK